LYDLEGNGSIGFEEMKRVARELGETMNDEELTEMMHHVHVLSKTGSMNSDGFS
jgi:Ca2+-binding EF-hand superfamily protein